MIVPTVDRGLREVDFWSIEIAGAEALDEVDVGLLHLPEELAGVRRQGLHVPALSLGVDRVEGQRRLAGAGEAREHDQLVARKLERDVPEVVLTGAVDDEGIGAHGRRVYRRPRTSRARLSSGRERSRRPGGADPRPPGGRPGASGVVRGRGPVLGEARLHQLRRSHRPDRDHARRAGRAPSVDPRGPVPARAVVLHGAPRPRGPAARDLHRVAAPRHARRDRRGDAVRASGVRVAAGALVDVRGAR